MGCHSAYGSQSLGEGVHWCSGKEVIVHLYVVNNWGILCQARY